MGLQVLLYSFLTVSVLQIIYYSFFSVFAFRKKRKSKSDSNLPISVIICAKNEEENLKRNLPSIINQDYPNFEIVLINDSSRDNTLEVMEKFQQTHKNIKIVNVEENENFWGNKKYALTLGIKAANNEHLLFTDADCKPVSNQWILSMSNSFTNSKTFVLGYGKLKQTNKSLLNLLVRFETLNTAIQYFTYAILGNPYMGVGRNLAYKKSEFFKTKGFIKHIQVRSGDDDLFIQEAANKHNTTINISSKSFTESPAKETYKDWFQQKRRHVSTSNYYKLYHKILLSTFFCSKLLFYVLVPFTIILIPTIYIYIPTAIFFILLFLVIGFASKKLKEKNITLFAPFLDLFLVISQFAIFITNLINKPTHWK